jgi:hypothetical protein
VAGCGDDFPFGVAQVQGVVVAEGLVDGVGGDGLVEVLRDAASRSRRLTGSLSGRLPAMPVSAECIRALPPTWSEC